MAVPELKVEMWLGGGWVDLVALGRIDLTAGLSITRGRANEYGQMGAGQCSFVLTNDDGAFTPELAASPWRSSLTLHRPVRVSESVDSGASWVTRFAGYVDDEPVDLEDSTGARARVTTPATGARPS